MTRTHARFISGPELGTVVDWDFGAVDQGSLRFAAKLKAQAEAEEQARSVATRQAGFAEGHAKGYAEGYEQGHAQATLEGQRQINEYISTQGESAARTFAQLFESASAQIADAEQTMAQGVLELACELARQVLRHEFSANPNALQPVVREALNALTVDNKAAVVRLNPVDLDVLAEVLPQEFPGLALTLLPDATMTRGGCLVESAGTVVDGTVEKRWLRAVSSLGLESSWELPDARD
jgi:flagellar assembly protein FliH